MIKLFNNFYYFLFILFVSVTAEAKNQIYEKSGDLYLLSKSIQNFINSLVFVGGCTLVFFGFKKFIDYRNDPIESPLRKSIMLIFIGAILILFKFLPIFKG